MRVCMIIDYGWLWFPFTLNNGISCAAVWVRVLLFWAWLLFWHCSLERCCNFRYLKNIWNWLIVVFVAGLVLVMVNTVYILLTKGYNFKCGFSILQYSKTFLAEYTQEYKAIMKGYQTQLISCYRTDTLISPYLGSRGKNLASIQLYEKKIIHMNLYRKHINQQLSRWNKRQTMCNKVFPLHFDILGYNKI